MHQLLISDANILIDMEEGLLTEKMFQLPYSFLIPDILFVEELEEQHQHLQQLGLQLGELSSETMIYAMNIIPRYTKASRNDCFALALAKQENCPLLTGDNALKRAAQCEAIEVKGTLWVVEQMLSKHLLTVDEAKNAYQLMKDSGRRLPWAIAEARLLELAKS